MRPRRGGWRLQQAVRSRCGKPLRSRRRGWGNGDRESRRRHLRSRDLIEAGPGSFPQSAFAVSSKRTRLRSASARGLRTAAVHPHRSRRKIPLAKRRQYPYLNGDTLLLYKSGRKQWLPARGAVRPLMKEMTMAGPFGATSHTDDVLAGGTSAEAVLVTGVSAGLE